MLNKTQLATLFRFAADLLSEGDTVPAVTPVTAENNPPAKRPGRPRKTDQPVNEPQQALPAEPETNVEQPARAPEPEKPKVVDGNLIQELNRKLQEVVDRPSAKKDKSPTDSQKLAVKLLSDLKDEPEKASSMVVAVDTCWLRGMIEPLIINVRGPEVKAVLNKYAPEGHSGDYTLALLSERPDMHAAFAADIEALLI